MADFLGGFGHSAGNDGIGVLGAAAQALFECLEARGQDKDGDEVVAHLGGELLRSLPVEIADDVPPSGERLINWPARRAVAIAEHRRMLEQLSPRHHFVETSLVYEPIIAAIKFTGAGRPSGHRYRQRELRILFDEMPCNRRLARPGRRREDKQQSPPPDPRWHSFDVLNLLAKLLDHRL